jgi:hypothetical protein
MRGSDSEGSLTIKEDSAKEARKRAVRQWQTRIRAAKVFFEKDFKRMRSDMDFAAGLQWVDQTSLQDPSDRYVANLTIRMVNQKVASLYARDPKAIARRRKRLDFQIWDGNMQSLLQAFQSASMAQAAGGVDVASTALMMDYMQGKQWQQLVEKVGRTLEILYQYECDSQDIPFKLEMKQLVRRIVTCGVGYVFLDIKHDETDDYNVESTGPGNSMYDRLQRVQAIAEKLKGKEIEPDDPLIEQLRLNIQSIQESAQRGEQANLVQRLEFDFPPSDKVIVDPNCRALKGFIGAQWIVREFIRPMDEVNTIFGLEGDDAVKAGSDEGSAKLFTEDGKELTGTEREHTKDLEEKKKLVTLWKVYDKRTRQQLYIVDGWRDYVCEPEAISPTVPTIFNGFACTFNDVETDPLGKASIYPPSDVQLIRCAQKEYNRVRETLRGHRKANAPTYVASKGMLTDNDKDALKAGVPNELIELENVPAGTEINKVVGILQKQPVDPNLYDARPIVDDIEKTVGLQDANLGPAKPHVTATVGNIAEQSRVIQSSSNVDDLDDLLTSLAKASGFAMLGEFDISTVQRIVGRGTVWPQDPAMRADFMNEIFLEVVAASSGRPNKQLDVQNFQAIAPTLAQAGANPWGLIQEGVKRLDDQLEPSDFAPLPVPTQGAAPAPGGQPTPGQPVGKPGQPPMPSGPPGVMNGQRP